MKCAEAIEMLIEDRATVVRHRDWLNESLCEYLWVKSDHIVCTFGESWGDSEICDWWDAGIPAELWNSDRWEVEWE